MSVMAVVFDAEASLGISAGWGDFDKIRGNGPSKIRISHDSTKISVIKR